MKKILFPCIIFFLTTCGRDDASLNGGKSTPTVVTSKTAPSIDASTANGNKSSENQALNLPPIAMIEMVTEEICIDKGSSVAFSGTNSEDDADVPNIVFKWEISSEPSGSTLSIPTPDKPDISITPQIAGTYKIGLVVSDGELFSDPNSFEFVI